MAAQAFQYIKDYGDRFLLLSFKELVSERDTTMRKISAWSGIDFDPSLLGQTFDSKSIPPNTNFDDPPERLTEAVFERKQHLTDEERARAYKLTESWRRNCSRPGGAADVAATLNAQIPSLAP